MADNCGGSMTLACTVILASPSTLIGKVAATVASDRLENINDVFARMHAGTIEGRVVLDFAA